MAEPNGSTGAFFQRLIDYAGLFPPAALGVSAAVDNYRAYLHSPHRWMLGRFVAATSHVTGLAQEQLALFSPESPLDISLVSKDPITDIPKVIDKVRGASGQVSIGSLEVALPVADDFEAALRRIEPVVALLDRPERKIPLFYELGPGEKWDQSLPHLLDSLAEGRGYGRMLGLKLRCGGLEPQLVPAPERVAEALAGAAARGIPVKFTAGLHHPFRHVQASPFPPMHGYFNVFYAALVAYLRCPAKEVLVSIVAEMERCEPVVDRKGIAWLGNEIFADEIARAREQFALSFGSCSFVEPIDDAQELGWL